MTGAASALVTGGASGIGAATAELLADRGYAVLIADVDRGGGERVATAVGGTFVELDVSDAAAWDAIPATDVAVLNAGVMTGVLPALVSEWTDEQWQRLRRVNIDGVVLGLRAVARSMRARGRGSIVLTGSTSGLSPFVADPLYSASKHFVVGLMRSAAPQLLEHGIHLNAICPTATDTPIISPVAKLSASSLIRPAVVAEAIVELLEGGGSGEAWTVLLGGGVANWSFHDIPLSARPGADVPVT